MCRAGRKFIGGVLAGVCLWGAASCLGSGNRDLEAVASTGAGDRAESVREKNKTGLVLAAEKATACSKEPVVLMADWQRKHTPDDMWGHKDFLFLFYSFRMEAVLPSGAKLVTDGLWRSDGELYDGMLGSPGDAFTLVSKQWVDLDKTGSYRLRLHCCEENRIDRQQESPQVISGRWKIASNWVYIEVVECSSSQLTSIANELLSRAKNGRYHINHLDHDELSQAHGRALSFFAEPEAIPALVSMFVSIKEYVARRLAMEGLARIGTLGAFRALMELPLESEAEAAALRGMLAILAFGSPGGEAGFLSGQREPDGSVRTAARLAVSRLEEAE